MHVMTLIDTPSFAWTVVMIETGRELNACANYYPGEGKCRRLLPAIGVKRIGPGEGRTIQIGNVRLTWKATGEDTGFATSLYEMDLAPGVGIPVHSHPYADGFLRAFRTH